MKREFLISGIVVVAGIVIMTIAAIGGWNAKEEWSDAYHAYVRSGEEFGAFEVYEAELHKAAYAWLFDTGEIVAFGGLAILVLGRAIDKKLPKPGAQEAETQEPLKEEKAHEDSSA